MKIRAECSDVNKWLAEMRKEDAERLTLTLALTILTVGVAGPIASVLVKDKAAKVLRKASGESAGQGFEDGPESGGRDG
jgi:hypothetical protein